MIVIHGNNNTHTLTLMYKAVMRGLETNSRGQVCRNVPNMMVVMSAAECPVTSFEARKLNLSYAKKEWLWYLGADKMDDSIEKHATMWRKLKQADGSYYSNYGQYIFSAPELPSASDEERVTPPNISQFEYVLKQLRKDRNTRRASMVLLNREHLFDDNSDTVCTYAINFTIIGDRLDMTVMMRSNDVVFGFTNDSFCFWNLYAMVFSILKVHYPELIPGQYQHFTNSMHVYDRHYDMLRTINGAPNGGHYEVKVPWPTAQESVELFKTRGQGGSGAYTDWLKA